jgi:hypothetical protein
MIRGSGGIPRKKFEIWGPRNGQILHSGSLVDSYIYVVYFTAILYLGLPLTRVPGQIAPLWAALTAPAVTIIYDSLVS